MADLIFYAGGGSSRSYLGPQLKRAPKITTTDGVWEGETATGVDPEFDDAATITARRWLHNTTVLGTSATQAVPAGVTGDYLLYQVTATGADGFEASFTSGKRYWLTAPQGVVAPSIPAAAAVGVTIVATPGIWQGAHIARTYQWKRDGATIAGATGMTYTTTNADADAALTVTETATNLAGSESATSGACEIGEVDPDLPEPEFDPATLSPVAFYDVQDMSTLWQDAAGTQQVTGAGQTVRRIDDLSGNGNHAISTDGAVLMQDAFGFHFLQVTTPGEAFYATVSEPSDWPVLGVAQYAALSDDAYGLSFRSGNNRLMGLNQRNATGLHVHANVTVQNVAIDTIDHGHVAMIADLGAEAVTFNGTEISHDYTANAPDAFPTGYAATWDICIGSSPEAAPTPGTSSVYAAIVIDGTLTSGERYSLNSWLESRCPVERIKDAALFPLIGQSNMIGKAEDTGLSTYPATAFEWRNDLGCVAAQSPLQHTGVDYDQDPPDVGFQAAFATEWNAAGRGDLVFVASANGGTGFSPNQWGPAGPSYDAAVAEVNAFTLMYGNAVTAFLWHQGEGDLDAPATYAASLYDMIDRFRVDVDGASDTSGSETPFILGQISENIAHFNLAAIRAVIEDTPNQRPATAVASDAGLTLIDGVHFGEASLVTLGERYYAKVAGLVGEDAEGVPILNAPDTGMVTITIEQPSEHAGTYTFDAADLAGGPVNLVPPGVDGDTDVGDTLTYKPGVWVYDVAYGPVVQAAEWYQAGVPTADYSQTRVISTRDADVGLSLVETASNAAGTRTEDTTAIADTFVQNGFETSDGTFAFTDPIAPNVTDTLLIFASYEVGPGAGRLIHVADDTFVGEGGLTITASDGGQWDYQSFGVSEGDRVNMLCAVDVPNESFQIILQVNDGAPTLVEDKEPGKLDVNLGEGEFILLNDAAGTKQFSGVHHRTALWVGGTLPNMDTPADAARVFWKTDGTVKNPLVSVYEIGTPLIDVHGTAAQAAANTINTGSLGAFDTVTGSFTDAIPAPPSAPVNTVPASIPATASVGATLTVTAGTWTGNPAPTLTYQWKLDGVDVPGETGSTYTADTAGTVSVVETATNSEGTASQASNDSTVASAMPADEALVTSLGGALFAGSRSTMHSDIAGTTPAVSDGLVGQIDALAGSAWAAPADANRLTLRTNGTETWLETGGASTALVATASTSGGEGTRLTTIAAVKFKTSTTNNRYWSQIKGDNWSLWHRYLTAGRNKNEVVDDVTSLLATSASPGLGENTWGVLTATCDTIANELKVWLDGTLVIDETATDFLDVTNASMEIAMGATVAATLGEAGNCIAYYLTVPDVLDATDRGAVEGLAQAEIPA